MNLIELSELLLNENLAEQYLLKHNILKTFSHCEKCNSNRITSISRGRYRCNNCESEWGNRKGSILHRQSLSASKLLGIIKLFELELTAIQTSKELDLPERTTQRMYAKIRDAIVGNTFLETNDKLIKGDSIKFSVTNCNGLVSINPFVNDEIRSNLFYLQRSRIPNKETTFYFKHLHLNSNSIRRKLNDFPVSQNQFWRFANTHLQKYRGTKVNSLYLFLKEVEFRYNNKPDLFNQLINVIACFEVRE